MRAWRGRGGAGTTRAPAAGCKTTLAGCCWACLPTAPLAHRPSTATVRSTPPLPAPQADQDLDAARPTDYDVRAFFLHRPRAQLYRRIDARVEEMVAGGLLTVR